jgi:hypothetical protein
MDKYLRSLSIFSALFIIVNSLVYWLVRPDVNDSWFQLKNEKDILIVGDSYTECAINDTLFMRATNMSQPAEAYLYTYLKLKKFLQVNPHVDSVVVGFSALNLNTFAEDWYDEESRMQRSVSRNFPLLRLNDLWLLFKREPGFLFNSCLITYKDYIKRYVQRRRISNLKQMNIGKYLFLNRNLSNNTANELNWILKMMEPTFSQTQIEYLRKIENLCNERKVSLILFYSPVHPSYPDSLKRSVLTLYQKEFSQIPLADFSSFVLPDSCYADLQHLNYKGARIFSAHLEKNFGKATLHEN